MDIKSFTRDEILEVLRGLHTECERNLRCQHVRDAKYLMDLLWIIPDYKTPQELLDSLPEGLQAEVMQMMQVHFEQIYPTIGEDAFLAPASEIIHMTTTLTLQYLRGLITGLVLAEVLELKRMAAT